MRITDAIARFFGNKGEERSFNWFGVGDLPSSVVSEQRATTLAPVFATIRHLVDYVSTLPADFYRVDGSRRIKISEPELIRNIEDEIGLGTWLGQAVYGILTQGNAVGRITSVSGWGLPTMVRWSGHWSGGANGYDWWVDGAPLPGTLVAHIPWIVPPGSRLGLSPIGHYAAIVNAGLSAQDYADVKRGGGVPPVVLKNTKQTVPADVAAAVQSRAVVSFASGKPFVTGSDWEIAAMTIPPNHTQFIETMKLTANQIAAIYGIDPREIGGDGGQGTVKYMNDESRPLNRADNARPYITRIEAAVNRMLPQSTVMKLNMDAAIRADIKTRTDVVGTKIADGRLSVNEARALEDLEPVTGGDFHNIPGPKTVPAQSKGVSP